MVQVPESLLVVSRFMCCCAGMVVAVPLSNGNITVDLHAVLLFFFAG